MKNVRLLFDYGHGKKTAGKRSPDGRLEEWKYVREVGSAVADYFQNILKFDVEEVVAADNPDDVSLVNRVAKVNKTVAAYPNQQCLLCSFHVNAAGSGKEWMKAEGWSVYVAKTASKESKSLANALFDAAAVRSEKNHQARAEDADRILFGDGCDRTGLRRFVCHHAQRFRGGRVESARSALRQLDGRRR